MKATNILFFLFISTFAFAQKSVKIKGKILVADAKPSGVHVINLNTEEEVVSDENGNFPKKIDSSALNKWVFNNDTIKKVVQILFKDG